MEHTEWPKTLPELKEIEKRIEEVRDNSEYPLSIAALTRLLGEVREEIEKLEKDEYGRYILNPEEGC